MKSHDLATSFDFYYSPLFDCLQTTYTNKSYYLLSFIFIHCETRIFQIHPLLCLLIRPSLLLPTHLLLPVEPSVHLVQQAVNVAVDLAPLTGRAMANALRLTSLSQVFSSHHKTLSSPSTIHYSVWIGIGESLVN